MAARPRGLLLFLHRGQVNLDDVQLLLTDMQKPHMDGLATNRALRKHPASPRINVQGFIAKPFTAASLLLALDAALHPK